jgi:hypothetical protein
MEIEEVLSVLQELKYTVVSNYELEAIGICEKLCLDYIKDQKKLISNSVANAIWSEK